MRVLSKFVTGLLLQKGKQFSKSLISEAYACVSITALKLSLKITLNALNHLNKESSIFTSPKNLNLKILHSAHIVVKVSSPQSLYNHLIQTHFVTNECFYFFYFSIFLRFFFFMKSSSLINFKKHLGTVSTIRQANEVSEKGSYL